MNVISNDGSEPLFAENVIIGWIKLCCLGFLYIATGWFLVTGTAYMAIISRHGWHWYHHILINRVPMVHFDLPARVVFYCLVFLYCFSTGLWTYIPLSIPPHFHHEWKYRLITKKSHAHLVNLRVLIHCLFMLWPRLDSEQLVKKAYLLSN